MLNLDMVGRVSDDKLPSAEWERRTFLICSRQADEALPAQAREFAREESAPAITCLSDEKDSVLFFYDKMLIDYHRPTDTATRSLQGLRGCGPGAARRDAMARSASAIKRQLRHPGPDANGGWSRTRAALGVVPDYGDGDDGSGGVKISGTVTGSAAKPPAQAGDVIVQFGDKS